MKRTTLLITAISMIAGAAHAVPIYNSFGPGDAFNSPGNVSIANDPVIINAVQVGTDRDWALSFDVVGQDYFFDSVELALLHMVGLSITTSVNEVDIQLREDSAGLPGSLIELMHLSNAMTTGLPTTGTFGSIVTATSSTNPLLLAGSTYWIEVSAGTVGNSDPSHVRWHSGQVNPMPGASQLDEGAWQDEGSRNMSMRVNASPIPEPHAVVLFGVGSLVVGASLRRRRC